MFFVVGYGCLYVWMGVMVDGGCVGCYSMKLMCEEGGYEVIKKVIEKLGLRYREYIVFYGEGNEWRLIGKYEIVDMNMFLWGVVNRGVLVCVGCDMEKDGKGYFEDRRLVLNMDLYVVMGMIVYMMILWSLEE